jgi:hypothetical protein
MITPFTLEKPRVLMALSFSTGKPGGQDSEPTLHQFSESIQISLPVYSQKDLGYSVPHITNLCHLFNTNQHLFGGGGTKENGGGDEFKYDIFDIL